MAESHIDSLQQESRRFTPDPAFAAKSHVSSMEAYQRLYQESIEQPDTFWARQAESLFWFRRWDKVLDWKLPHARWFVNAKTNLSYNCLDRHLNTLGEKTAILWEGEPGEKRALTYKQLHADVCRFANVLKSLGVEAGDRVAVYMPLVPELAVAILACARIGATHSVIFGGFSAQAIVDRVNDAQAKLIITADGGYRRGKVIDLKGVVDEAMSRIACVRHVVVLRRAGNPAAMTAGRDCWWHEVMDMAAPDCPAAELDAEHPLFILYTSGSTGKPKGVLHTTAGYMVGAAVTTKYVFDLRPEDIYWCTADIGWVTGHSYVVYGPLANGATTLMYEGAPDFPAPDRFWKIIEDYRVSIFYTAPTAIRAFRRWGDEHVNKHDLSSLRLLGSVGEPINPEAWIWYYEVIGKKRCPIVDTWWQTETGSIMITTLPGAAACKPGSAGLPFFGVAPEIRAGGGGVERANDKGGLLVLKQPWPSMLRTLYGDDDRYRQVYWSKYPDAYFTGDAARCDADGYYWLMGRVDDVLNVSGHRLGTAEVESALVSHPGVAEAAVVGMPHEIKGESVAAFVTPKAGVRADETLRRELSEHVVREIGALARPDQIRFTAGLPKTRSGKIMRRLLKDIAAGREIRQDTTTLEDFSILARLREEDEG